MGFFDELSSTLNRGAEATARTAQSLKLKAQVADLNNQRKNVCSRLGAAVYDRLKDDENFQEGLEDIFEAIANCDQRISALQEEIDKIEAESAARAKVHWVDSCPCCGYKINHGDSFCCRCGTKIPKNPIAEDVGSDAASAVTTDDVAPNAPIDVEPIIDSPEVPCTQPVEDAENGSDESKIESSDAQSEVETTEAQTEE